MIQIDEWFAGSDGIGKILSVHPIYIEEFSLSPDKAIGYEDRKIVVYKIFCNYKGKLISRNNIRPEQLPNRQPYISKENQLLLEGVVEKNAEAYSKFEFLATKPMHHYINTWMQLPPKNINLLEDELVSLSKTYTNGFTILDVKEKIEQIYGNIDPFKYSHDDKLQIVCLELDNLDFVTRDKRAVFVSLEMERKQKMR